MSKKDTLTNGKNKQLTLIYVLPPPLKLTLSQSTKASRQSAVVADTCTYGPEARP